MAVQPLRVYQRVVVAGPQNIMAEFPALPLFTDAFIADTTHLDATETGAYLMLLIVAWRSSDCSLPNDDRILARYARLDLKKWLRVKKTVLSFWKTRQDGNLYQGRLQDEKNFVILSSHKQSVNAKARWLKDNNTGNATAYAKRMPNECQIDAPHPHPHPQKKKGLSPSLGPQNQFEKFWEIFPKQRAGSRSKALSAYEVAITRADEPAIIAGAASYARSDEVSRGYAKGAAAWLNDDRWSSDYSQPLSKGKNYGYAKSSREQAAIDALKGIHQRGLRDEQYAGENESGIIENNLTYIAGN